MKDEDKVAFQWADFQLKLIERMASSWCSQEAIATVLEMKMDDFTYRIRRQDSPGRLAYERGRAAAEAHTMNKLHQLIENGEPSAVYFTCKCKLGWRETTKYEVSGPDGQPIDTRVRVVVMTPDNGKYPKIETNGVSKIEDGES